VFLSFSLPYGLGITIRTMTLVSSIKESGYEIFIQETMTRVSSTKRFAVTFSSKKQGVMESFGQLIANVGTLCQLVGYSWIEGWWLWVITRVLIANQSAGILIFISYNLQKAHFRQFLSIEMTHGPTFCDWWVTFSGIFGDEFCLFYEQENLGNFGIVEIF